MLRLIVHVISASLTLRRSRDIQGFALIGAVLFKLNSNN